MTTADRIFDYLILTLFILFICFQIITYKEFEFHGIVWDKKVPASHIPLFFWRGVKRRYNNFINFTLKYLVDHYPHFIFLVSTYFINVPPPSLPLANITLKIKRSQKLSPILHRPIFILDAQLDAPNQMKGYISIYRLSGRVVYDSPKRKQRGEASADTLRISVTVQVCSRRP